MSSGKIYFLIAGIFIGNGAVINHWTHVVYYDPIIFFCGIGIVILAWRMK